MNMKGAVGPLQEFELRAFIAQTKMLVEWKCIPLLVMYCCDIPQRT